jgi:hypothetical protein
MIVPPLLYQALVVRVDLLRVLAGSELLSDFLQEASRKMKTGIAIRTAAECLGSIFMGN